MEFKGSRLELKPTPDLGSSKNKMLHVVYRVGNIDRAIKFYQDVFGMEVRDVPAVSGGLGCCCWFTAANLDEFSSSVLLGIFVIDANSSLEESFSPT